MVPCSFQLYTTPGQAATVLPEQCPVGKRANQAPRALDLAKPTLNRRVRAGTDQAAPQSTPLPKAVRTRGTPN